MKKQKKTGREGSEEKARKTALDTGMASMASYNHHHKPEDVRREEEEGIEEEEEESMQEKRERSYKRRGDETVDEEVMRLRKELKV